MWYEEDLLKYRNDKIKKDLILSIFKSYNYGMKRKSKYITNLIYENMSQNIHIFEKISSEIDEFIQYLIEDGFYAIHNPYDIENFNLVNVFTPILINPKYGVTLDISSVANKFSKHISNEIMELMVNRNKVFRIIKFYIHYKLHEIVLNELLYRFIKRGLKSFYQSPPNQGTSSKR